MVQKKLSYYTIYPIKVCELERTDHHDLLLFGEASGNEHYCRIINLSKLVGSQMSQNGHVVLICKRCFKSYFGINRRGVSAEQRLKDHKLNCNKNKPLLPVLASPNTFMKFENINRTRKHPFAIYADF
ncbi:unnamed protein product [Macrosiphum euphorbiae]|uniref:GIY-YIG homing endonuclease n=1 Tax=Macrosiphum euphorbiae TaxID=13131 RepID=A0AAV0VU03_9HEMI|nr:unnamed protein product [Macrosiphum euphorbiae]